MAAMTIAKLQKKKQQGEKIASLTAYDASFAKLMAEQGVDCILVGDSLGNVVQGRSSTVPVTMTDMTYHTECVRRGAPDAFIMSDLPFMSYGTLTDTLKNAAQLMQAGANMVKLEGGDWLVDSVKALTQRGIPVCAHLGLIPQSVNVLGGYRVQGKQEAQAVQLIEQAKQLEAAGAQLLVLECIPNSLGKRVTEALSIPTIGIGAGPDTDGQILVMHDMLGMNSEYLPKFAKNFLAEGDGIAAAFREFSQQVKSGQFPELKHSYEG
ncbi:MAG: 3-methyl-2-oxobutanoate hydroxymethyltransferase [Pseudomonadota bacterium]|nr:3-methyl-2-oxobutanoate hydroxymethyltransferase [Pseudomonadota bacterium]